MVGNPIFCYATYGCKFFCRDLRIITDYFKNGFRSVGRSFRSRFRSVGWSFRSLFDVFSQFKTSFDSVRITLFSSTVGMLQPLSFHPFAITSAPVSPFSPIPKNTNIFWITGLPYCVRGILKASKTSSLLR